MGIVREDNGADPSFVTRHSPFIPDSAEFRESDWDRGEVRSAMVCAELLVKLNVLGNLTYMYCGVNGIIWVLHEIASGGNTSKRRVGNAQEC